MNEHIENTLQATLQEIHSATANVGDVEETARTVATLSRSLDMLVSHGNMPAPTTPEPEGVEPSIEGSEDDSISLESEEEAASEVPPEDDEGEEEEPMPEPELDVPEEDEEVVEDDEYFDDSDELKEAGPEDLVDADSTKEDNEPATAEEAESELDALWEDISGE